MMQSSHRALPRVKKTTFQCTICPAEFSNRFSLRRHWKFKHPEHFTDHEPTTQEVEKALIARCLEPNCELTFISRHELRRHLIQEHALREVEIHREFSTEEDFFDWKNKIENCTNCNYIRACGSATKKDGTRLVYFDCGWFGEVDESSVPVGKKTCKIGTLCPSQLAVQVEWEKVSVIWYPGHYGHSISLEHIRIPKLERKTIKERNLPGEEFNRSLYDAEHSEEQMEVPDEITMLLELEDGQIPASQPDLSLSSQEPYIPETSAISVDFDEEENEQGSHSSLRKAHHSSPAALSPVDIELEIKREPFFRLLEEAREAVEKLDFTVDTSNALSSLSASVQKLKYLSDPERRNRPPAPNPLVWKQNSVPVEINIDSPEPAVPDEVVELSGRRLRRILPRKPDCVGHDNLHQNDNIQPINPEEEERTNFCLRDARSDRVPEEEEVTIVEEVIVFPIKHCPLPRLLDKKAILELLGIDTREEVISVSDHLEDEHTYAVHASIKLDDLTQEELNLLKVLVDPDFLRAFLKQLRKGALSPLEEASLTSNELFLNDLSWPILVLRVYPNRILSSLFTPDAFSKVVAALDEAREHWKCADCKYVREERMIMCDECSLWFHFSCQDLESAPPTEFQCRDCYLKPWNSND